MPVKRRGGGGEAVVAEDEEVAKVDFAKVPSLRPVFKAAQEGGTITAANASSLSDGASALVLMSAARAAELGVKPLAVIRGFGDAEQAPMEFPTAPSLAIPVALQRAGMCLADVDYHEVNEAFAVVALANAARLGLLAQVGAGRRGVRGRLPGHLHAPSLLPSLAAGPHGPPQRFRRRRRLGPPHRELWRAHPRDAPRCAAGPRRHCRLRVHLQRGRRRQRNGHRAPQVACSSCTSQPSLLEAPPFCRLWLAARKKSGGHWLTPT